MKSNVAIPFMIGALFLCLACFSSCDSHFAHDGQDGTAGLSDSAVANCGNPVGLDLSGNESALADWHIEEKIDIISVFPEFPGFSRKYDSQIVMVYEDKRDDYDGDDAISSSTITEEEIRNVWNEGYGILKNAPERDGYAFLGWRFDALASCGIDVSKACRKYVEISGFKEEEFIKASGLSIDSASVSDMESIYNVRIFLPGEDIGDYYEKIICALYSDENADPITGECGRFPWSLKFESVWTYSGVKATINYYDDFYNAQGVKYASKIAFKRDMRYGTPSFGSISTWIPVRSGYTFCGWKDEKTGEVLQPGSNYRSYFNSNYSGSDESENICDLHPLWERDESFFYKVQSSDFMKSSSNASGSDSPKSFEMGFSAVPCGVSAFVSRMDNRLLSFRVPESFAIATQDVSGSQFLELLKANKARVWGFDEDGLKHRESYVIDILEDYSIEANKTSDWNAIMTHGVKVDYSKQVISHIDANGEKHPIVYLNMPQAMLICNMFTAAYNECHDDKLTFAYAYSLVEDVDDVSVIKTVSKAIQYITEASGANLALPDATGFRLPRSYEYQVASSLVPYSSALLTADNLLNSGFPLFVKNAANCTGLFGNANYNSTSSNPASSGSANPLGMYHSTGNVRKWLDSKLDDVGDSMRIGSEVGDVLTVSITMPHVFKEDYSDATNWFSGFRSVGISAKVKKISADGKEVTFELSCKGKKMQMVDIISTLTVPSEKFEDCSENVVIENAVTVSVVSTDTYFMVRSGSFALEKSECDVHKMFDSQPDMRKSSSTYEYASIDLGMRLARSL